MNILIADDEMICSLILKKILERSGHVVTSVTNGEQLINVFRSSPDSYDLIITDVMMPHVSGIDAATEIKKYKDIKIIAISASWEDHSATDENGNLFNWKVFDKYLQKPIDIFHLNNTIKTMTEEMEIK